MSTSVDQRVVEMRFDNKQFESNVSNTMSTLEKLKQKLNLTGASKGLDNINAAAKNVNMNGLGGAVETVTAKFSALQVMGVTALANITNSAVNAGKNIVRSLTIDPIKSGFSEYETKMGSIQTIMANTEHQGTTLNDVTAALEELNLYADKTIYNFQEMTRNIGTFTAAGVDLDTSVRSIQGIANLAAVSGSTSQQASTAMYQLSQALATGTVKLQDWNSVVNAGMGGKVFQNALIQTAAMLNGASDDVEAWQKENIDAFGSFRESLTQGQWLTSEVLTKTLEQFTMAAEEGSEQWEKFKQSLMSEGYTEEQAESILKMANTATDAATKVKTFTQLLDTLKESAQSGWAQTWESIVGDFEEAKEFFTTLSDLFGGIIGDSAERRNKLIGDTMSSSWEKLTGKINEAGIETAKFEESIKNVVGASKFDELVADCGSLEKAVRSGAISSDTLKKALKGLNGEALDFSDLSKRVNENRFLVHLGQTGDDVKLVQKALVDLGYELEEYGPDGKFGKETYTTLMEFQRANGLVIDGIAGPETIAALQKAGASIDGYTGDVDELTKSCEGLTEELTKKSGRELLLESLMNIIHAIHRPLAAVGEAFRDVFAVSPDQLYNALEAINKFTGKFVMKGFLDITTWDELVKKINEYGIATPKFMERLSETLEDNGINVESLKKKYGGLKEAFDAGAISMDHVKEALLTFDGISESLLLGGENAEKVRRAFEGLFAALEIVTSIAGGGLKFAFKVLTSVLDHFGVGVLDVAASLGDSIIALRDWLFEENLIAKGIDYLISKIPGAITVIQEWYNTFKQTPAVMELVDAIKAIRKAFDDLFSGKISISDLAASLGTNLAKAVKSLPGIAIQIGKDFLAGFVNGLGDGVTGIIGSVIRFCVDFVSAFASALGVQSPSWKAYDIAVDFFQGFINGCKAIFATVKGVLKTVGEKVVDVFKSIWDAITDESGKIQWDKIIAGGIMFSVLWALKQFATAFKGIADAFGGIGYLLKNVADSVKSFNKVLNAYAFDLRAKAIQKLAIAVAILAASIWVLAQIDDPKALWNAVGVIAAMAVIVVALAIAMDKMSKASAKFDGKTFSVEGLKSSLLSIGIVIMLLAAAVKLIGSMDPEEAKHGFLGLAAIAGGLIVFMAAMTGLSRLAKDVDKIGGLMTKMAIAMLLMASVVKLVAGLNAEEMIQGGIFATAFVVFVRGIVWATKNAGDGIDKIGGMLVKLSIAMMLMVGVCKLASMLSAEEMIKGAAFAGAFVLFVKALVWATKVGKEQQIAKIGGMILAISTSLLMMVGLCKLINRLSVTEMVKGAAFMLGFAVLLRLFIGVLKIGKEDKIAKVGGALLAMSAAIAILAGVAILLGFIPIENLAKGVTAVTIMGLLMVAMASALRGANDVSKSIMMMAIAIGIMAAAVIAMSFIDPADLVPAATAMTMLLGMFAFMLAAGRKAQDCIGTVIAMTFVIVVFAGMLSLMQDLDPTKAIGNAAALSLLMLSLSATMTIIGKVGNKANDALGAMVALGILAGLIGWVLVELSKMNPGPTLEIAKSLSLTLLAMSAAALILSKIGPAASMGITGAASFLGLVVAAGAILGVLGGLVAKIPGAQEFLDAGIPIIESIGQAIGSLIGGIIGGIGEGMMDSFSNMVDTFGTVVDKLVEISDAGTGINANGFDGVEKLLGVMGSIALTMAGSSLGDWFTFITGNGNSMEKFQKDGIAFFEAMAAISEASAGVSVNGESVDAVIGVAEKLVGLQSSLDSIGGVMSWFTGRDDLATFGLNAGLFIQSMKIALSNLDGFSPNVEGVGLIVQTATALSKLQSSLEPIGGVISWFTGRDDLATFGLNVGAFIESMKIALSNLDGFTPNTAAIDAVVLASAKLAELQNDLEPIGGMITWFKGRDDLGKFGENVGVFIESMKTALSGLDGFSVNSDGLEAVIAGAEKLSELQATIEPMDGVIDWFTGRSDLSVFGNNVALFITSMKTALGTLEGAKLDEAALTSVITAATKLSELQSQLEPMGGVIAWFTGQSDLGTFGTNVGLFADAMGKLKSGMGENGITEEVVTSVINAGTAIIELEKALPEEGWFDGKMSLSDFSTYVSDFGTAMGGFATSIAEMDQGLIDTAINTAYRIKTLIGSLADLDTSGMADFAGGNFSDGALLDMGQAIAGFAGAVADINVDAVNTSVVTANSLKNLISGLAGLDTSGIENFKIDAIGSAIAGYCEQVAGLNIPVVGASIDAANRLKTFITALVGLDTSGITNFRVGSIGKELGNYAGSVAGADMGAVNASVSAANRLKDFINGLTGLDSSGVAKFKSAINQLSTVDLNSAIQAFSGKAGEMKNAAASFVNALSDGIKGGSGKLSSAMQTIVNKTVADVRAKANLFNVAGGVLMTELRNGINDKSGPINTTMIGIISNAISGVRANYYSARQAGIYIGEGLRNGVDVMEQAVYYKGYELGAAVIRGIKDGADENSPSKLAHEAGVFVGEGLVLGVDSMGNAAYKSGYAAGNEAITGLSNSISRISDVINSDMDTQPTIRPVLDLSDVRAGAGAISSMFNSNPVSLMTNVGAISSSMSRRGQNGADSEVVTAINKLRRDISNMPRESYNINGITYDDGSNVASAMREIVRAARTERRV